MGALAGTSRRQSVWRVYLLVGGLACAAFALVPPFQGNGILMNVLGLSAVLAVPAGMRLHKPASSAPWAFFFAGLMLFWLGDLYTIGYDRLFHAEVPFPSVGDSAYVGVYPVLMVGLWLLLRRRNPTRDRGGSIDSLIITIGLSLLSWVGLIAPNLHSDSSTIERLVSIAYPIGDILLLAAAIRLTTDAGRREPAFYLLTSSIVCLLLTDFAYDLILIAGDYDDQIWLDVGWIGFYLLWGAAALHPSMRRLEQPSPDHTARLSPFRLVLLTAASLIAPVLAIVRELSQRDLDLIVIAVASGLLFALVVARMAGLVRANERAVARERILSAAGTELVAATDRRQTTAITLEAAGRLAGRHHRVTLLLDDEVPATACPAGELRLPLTIRGETRGVLCVIGDAPIPGPVHESLAALVTQVAMALEGAKLTEEVARQRSEARFGSLVRHSSDLITVLSADGTIRYQSPSVERVLGYDADALVGQRFTQLLDPQDPGRLPRLLADGAGTEGETTLECSLRHRDGGVRWFEVQYTDLLEEEHVHGIVLNSRDISERKAFERELAHQAFHDPVTDLANRALFGERVRHAIARSRREGGNVAVLFLDLDDFKTINDSLGHAAGDHVLVEVGRRLTDCIRAGDTAARFGGDEFAVLLEGIESEQEAADAAERIIDQLAVPFTITQKEISIRCSVGLAVLDAAEVADVEADELLRNADAAMYSAKRDGKGLYRRFEASMHEGVLARLELRADLQRALTADELELHYQPVVRLSDGETVGFEALLRWNHPERGLVGPDEFIPFAEETGLIVPIGRWVLREGCRRAVALQRARPDGRTLGMSVNLSVKQLQHSDVVADVRDALEETGLDPERLTLEITETVVMADTELAVVRLNELKALGVRLAMDDFGTGYSSLSYLSRFPVDALKMDRSFLRDVSTPELSSLATAVIALGQNLGLQVIAEGIESDDQRRQLRELGCHLGQGHLFAAPMDAFAAIAFLQSDDDHVPARPRADVLLAG